MIRKLLCQQLLEAYIFHDNFNSFGDCPNYFYFFMDAGVQNAAVMTFNAKNIPWAPSSEFVSSSIPSWQILTAHAQPFRGARDLAFCLKVPLVSLLVWASSGGSGETARMRRLAWTFAARIGDKYQIRLTGSPSYFIQITLKSYSQKIWAGPWENVSNVICEQRRHRSDCASMQSDQCLCCSLLR